jgi:hypothetical protein
LREEQKKEHGQSEPGDGDSIRKIERRFHKPNAPTLSETTDVGKYPPPRERTLRRAVIWRKVGFGNHSDEGCRFTERLLTVVQTLRVTQPRP